MLTIKFLGCPTLQLDNQMLSNPMAGRTGALLAYLAVTRQPQSRSLLADLLWDNVSEQQARTNLRYILRDLRYLIGDHLIVNGESVAFNQDLPHWVDVTVFTTHMTLTPASATCTIEPEILQELIKLYTGEFLAGFQIENASGFDRWLFTQRRYLHDMFIQGLQLRIQQHYTEGDYAAGLELNRYFLLLEPWREEAHRHQMLLFAHLGQRSAALKQYRLCCQALAEELDVPPMEQTTALYEEIKSGQWYRDQEAVRHRHSAITISSIVQEAPEPHTMGNNLSRFFDLGAMPEPAHFWGRDAELATLHSWVGQEHSRLIAILGLRGQGKTALASVFVQDVIEQGPNTANGFQHVIWRSLHGAPSCIEILQEWLQELGRGSYGELSLNFDQLISQLFAILQERRCLLVLDGIDAVMEHPYTEVGGHTDRYHHNSEGYDKLFRLFFQRRHHSCLLLTSLIRPRSLTYLDERNGAFRQLQLGGVAPEYCASFLAAYGIVANQTVYQQLHRRYAGNPLLLNRAATLICELFNGDAEAFLQEGFAFLGDIGIGLTHHLAKLSPLEQQIIQLLTDIQEPLCRQTLWQNLTPPPATQVFFRALQNLQRMFLIRQDGVYVKLPDLLSAYLTERALLQG